MKRKIIRRKKKRRVLKPRIKLLPRQILHCRYCKHYLEGKAFKEGRHCPIIDRKVFGELSLACSKFKRNKFIFCDKKPIQQFQLEVCKNRVERGVCKNCRQWDKELDILIQKRKLNHTRRLLHNRERDSILTVKRKKKRVLRISDKDRREANVNIGVNMLRRFGRQPWMNQYPEIFQKVKKKRTLKHKNKGRKKWQGKGRVLTHKT